MTGEEVSALGSLAALVVGPYGSIVVLLLVIAGGWYLLTRVMIPRLDARDARAAAEHARFLDAFMAVSASHQELIHQHEAQTEKIESVGEQVRELDHKVSTFILRERPH